MILTIEEIDMFKKGKVERLDLEVIANTKITMTMKEFTREIIKEENTNRILRELGWINY